MMYMVAVVAHTTAAIIVSFPDHSQIFLLDCEHPGNETTAVALPLDDVEISTHKWKYLLVKIYTRVHKPLYNICHSWKHPQHTHAHRTLNNLWFPDPITTMSDTLLGKLRSNCASQESRICVQSGRESCNRHQICHVSLLQLVRGVSPPHLHATSS